MGDARERTRSRRVGGVGATSSGCESSCPSATRTSFRTGERRRAEWCAGRARGDLRMEAVSAPAQRTLSYACQAPNQVFFCFSPGRRWPDVRSRAAAKDGGPSSASARGPCALPLALPAIRAGLCDPAVGPGRRGVGGLNLSRLGCLPTCCPGASNGPHGRFRHATPSRPLKTTPGALWATQGAC